MTDMRTQASATALDLLRRDPRVAVLIAEISLSYFRGAIEHDPRRAVNVGIMEQSLVGVAAGFAMEGFHPIVHTIAPFLAERPFEQVKLDFGYQGLGGTFVSVGASYDYAAEGGTHHAPGDVQAMLSIPRMQVLVPGHASEIDALVRATYANGLPTYVRGSTAVNRDSFDVEPGRLEVVRRGSRATLLAFGPMLSRTLDACSGLDVSVLYATSVEPFDHRGLASLAGPDPLVLVAEPFYEGTSVPAIAESLRHLPSRIVPIGVPRAFLHRYGTAGEHDRALGLDAAGIRRRVSTALG